MPDQHSAASGGTDTPRERLNVAIREYHEDQATDLVGRLNRAERIAAAFVAYVEATGDLR